ncbi:hypothetical protein BB347_08125 [Natronorubrum daqingense]|uniref:Uncharacterized protein n=1 Tax=Natronorubrum daqingense TaxID=588898 RepID=A0A1P8RD43_9EURY|nr:hypothetical protein BB347_08125 [Natronorubrum daqingense]
MTEMVLAEINKIIESLSFLIIATGINNISAAQTNLIGIFKKANGLSPETDVYPTIPIIDKKMNMVLKNIYPE